MDIPLLWELCEWTLREGSVHRLWSLINNVTSKILGQNLVEEVIELLTKF
jgi:hypothetical protein